MKPRPVIAHIDLMPQIIDELVEDLSIPNLYVTINYLQVAGMIRDGEVSRLLIILGIWNTGRTEFGKGAYWGRTAATELHKIDPNLPILIFNGREETMDPKGNWYKPPLQFSNEVYVSESVSRERKYALAKKFFEGHLSPSDVPQADYLGWFTS